MILTLNCGSSSIKYALFTQELKLVKKGNLENIKDHEKSFKTLFSSFSKEEREQISTISHRIVHGGEIFTKATKITPKNLSNLKKLSSLAPLHNPIQVKGIELCQKLFPKTKNIAIFDTAFHQSMKPEHFLYALPKKYYTKHAIRKYGFHGTSHQYLRETYTKKYLKKSIPLLDKATLGVPQSGRGVRGGFVQAQPIITCHLGNGSSIALIQNGKVIETSMGFTPLDGVIMGTRCGSIDPAIIPCLMQKEHLSPEKTIDLLNKQSGLLALSETTSDMKQLLEKQKSDPKARLAITMFVNSVVKIIGSYIALSPSIPGAIIFSGGIGERSAYLRNQIKKHFRFLPSLRFVTIPTNEELLMAQQSIKVK